MCPQVRGDPHLDPARFPGARARARPRRSIQMPTRLARRRELQTRLHGCCHSRSTGDAPASPCGLFSRAMASRDYSSTPRGQAFAGRFLHSRRCGKRIRRASGPLECESMDCANKLIEARSAWPQIPGRDTVRMQEAPRRRARGSTIVRDRLTSPSNLRSLAQPGETIRTRAVLPRELHSFRTARLLSWSCC